MTAVDIIATKTLQVEPWCERGYVYYANIRVHLIVIEVTAECDVSSLSISCSL